MFKKYKILKISSIIFLLLLSHLSFYLIIDQNRSSIRNFLLENKLIDIKKIFFLKKVFKGKYNYRNLSQNKLKDNFPENFNLTFIESNHQIIDLLPIISSDDDTHGLITSVEKLNNNFHILTSGGFILILDKDYKLKKKINLKSIFKNFHTDLGLGGIRGAVWKNKDKVFIYTTAYIGDKYKIIILSIDITNKKVVDSYTFEDLLQQDGYAVNLGGGIELINDNIILTIGDGSEVDSFDKSLISQNDISFYGKIISIKINKLDNDFYFDKVKLLAKGIRNSQGLKLIDNNIIFVEHGPRGGDKVAILENSNDIINYGWPIFSYGQTYETADTFFERTELKKTHNSYDKKFKKPIFYFNPSIATSDLAQCPFTNSNYNQFRNCIVVSSLKDTSFYILKYDKPNEEINIKSFERIFVGERIRKLFVENNIIYLFLDSFKIIKIIYK